jgi:hypothetical protein
MTWVARPVALVATGLYGRSLSLCAGVACRQQGSGSPSEGLPRCCYWYQWPDSNRHAIAAGAFETPMSTIPTHWYVYIIWCDRLDFNQGLPACRAGTLLRRPHSRRVLNFILSPGENDRCATAQNPLSYECVNLVRLPGLEPGTSCVSGRRSTAEL